jgi:RNA polymerase sigma-70 factor, ECF subfamily
MKPNELPPAASTNSARNPDELTQRFELFRPYLLAMARKQVAIFPCVDEGGSDFVQETYLAARKQWPNFRGSSPDELLSWFRAILRNQIARRRRQQQKARAAASAAGAVRVVAANAVGSQAPPDSQLEREEDYLLLLRLVQEMPEVQRQIIEGRIERDETFREIGRRLNMSEDAVRMAFHRALEQIRGYYQATATVYLRAQREGRGPPTKP